MGRPKKEKPNRTDGLYEVKVTVGKTFDGKLIRKSFYSSTSKDDARKQGERYKIEQEVAMRTNTTFIEKDITFSTWADKWLEIYKKPNVSENTYNGTYLLYVEKHLKPYFGAADLKAIRPADVQKFYAEKKDLSNSALSKIEICLNGIFETAIDNDLCYKNPVKFVSPRSEQEKKEKKFYTEDQEKVVREIAMSRLPGIVLCLETGLRPGEFTGLKWTDIQDGVLSVNRSIAYSKSEQYEERPPKWGSYRQIPLSTTALEALARLHNQDEYIYPMRRNTPYTPRAWDKTVDRFFSHEFEDHPEIPRLTPHEFRHTFGTRLRRNGVDLYTIQKLMGHKNIKVTTETYIHNEIEVLKKALGV